jgi:hypothetical protein
MSNKWPSFRGTFLKAQLQNGPDAEELLAQVFSPKNSLSRFLKSHKAYLVCILTALALWYTLVRIICPKMASC